MLALLIAALVHAAPPSFDGTFRADEGVLTLRAEHGVVTGTVVLDSEHVALLGEVKNGVLVGRAIDGYKKEFRFHATLRGGVLTLTIAADSLAFTRVSGSAVTSRSNRTQRGAVDPARLEVARSVH